MKNLILLVLASVALALSGCMASDTIAASSTKLQMTSPTGKNFAFTFPKELDARKFALNINPDTNQISLTADSITSSSQGVINSAANAQAQAMSDMAKTVSSVVSTVTQLATGATVPAAPPAPEPEPAK